MSYKLYSYALWFMAFAFLSCAHKAEHADLVIHNAIVYTLDEENTVTEAIAIKDGKIIETGKERHIMNKYSADEYIDAKARAVYPGFFDAHCHILNYGKTFLEVDLKNCNSWEETVNKVIAFAKKNKESWIVGRGWDQNKWADKKFPTNDLLNKNFPETPVYLTRVDGHAAIVNNYALDLAGITDLTTMNGGTIIREETGKKATGVLIDNAMDIVSQKIPPLTIKQMRKALAQAGSNTSSYGLTTLCDAGSDIEVFNVLEQMQKENMFMQRVYGMLVPTKADFDFAKKHGKYNKNDMMLIRSFKIVADGALGSRGACLKAHYSDESSTIGKLLFNQHALDSLIGKMYDLDYQVNTHCIGDSANAVLLRLYAKYLEKTNDKRWRIEHAQIMDLNDINQFGKYSILPSVQPTHAVSDMPWVQSRVGDTRIKGAYVYQTLLKQNGILALGTDFPVEDINPFKTFYAAVTRKYYDGKPIPGFENETLSRIQALLGMTKWAAMAAFMDEKTGSLEKGKYADIIILDRDILKINEADILKALVVQTYINGKRVHSLE
jgi:predicted amidohydrolase YtcJ